MTAHTPPVIDLTPQQNMILRELVLDGAGNPAIAERTGLSLDTVKTHLSHVMDRVDIHNRTALAVAVLRRRVLIRVVDNNANRRAA